jgi:hypothetical protein
MISKIDYETIMEHYIVNNFNINAILSHDFRSGTGIHELWEVTPCRLVETYRHFGENFLINIQGRGSNES